MQMQFKSSYYAVLGVHPDASAAEIRAAYHRLAMRWHPDKVAGNAGRRADAALAEEAKARFQQIHEAYKVLSDEHRRALYDAGMYDPLDDDDDEQEEVEGFHDFLQEMVSLMDTFEKEEPVYTLGELQSMLDGMMHHSPPPPAPPSFFSSAGSSRVAAPGSGLQSPTRSRSSTSSSSSRVHPQRFGSAACFTFSGC